MLYQWGTTCWSTTLSSKILAGDWYQHTERGGAVTEQCTSSSNEQKRMWSTETEMETEVDDSCQTRIVISLMLKKYNEYTETMMTSKLTTKQLSCCAPAPNSLIWRDYWRRTSTGYPPVRPYRRSELKYTAWSRLLTSSWKIRVRSNNKNLRF